MSMLTALCAKAAATAAATALVVAPVLGATPASAEATPAALGPRLVRACDRIPHRIERVEKIQARLHGDAQSKGSIAFLQARIDKAKAEGKNDLARVLTDRLAIRKDVDSQLPDILAKLKDAQQVCAEHTTSAPSSTAAKASS